MLSENRHKKKKATQVGETLVSFVDRHGPNTPSKHTLLVHRRRVDSSEFPVFFHLLQAGNTGHNRSVASVTNLDWR
jgi:hypothetical protein